MRLCEKIWPQVEGFGWPQLTPTKRAVVHEARASLDRPKTL
jgi:hypothetical protein